MSSSSSDDDHSSENQQQNENVFGRHSEAQKDGQLVESSILQPPPKQRVHKKYGKMIVFCQKPIFISIGPDYWCFIPAFIIFSIAAYYLTKFVITNTKSVWFQSLTLLICGGFIFSYLAVAISNPGVVTQNQINLEQQNEMKKSRPRQCKKCNIIVNRRTRHCDQCDVCVQQYDHHCPWTSKCIGKGNLCRFYFFLSMVPIFLVYIFIAFSVVMAGMPHKNPYHIKRHTTSI